MLLNISALRKAEKVNFGKIDITPLFSWAGSINTTENKLTRMNINVDFQKHNTNPDENIVCITLIWVEVPCTNITDSCNSLET